MCVQVRFSNPDDNSFFCKLYDKHIFKVGQIFGHNFSPNNIQPYPSYEVHIICKLISKINYLKEKLFCRGRKFLFLFQIVIMSSEKTLFNK